MSKAPVETPQLKVRVLSPSKQYFDGAAESVTAQNEVGQFDILADHANFFTLLSPGMLIVATKGQKFELPINQGLLKVAHNQVTAFVDIEGMGIKEAAQ